MSESASFRDSGILWAPQIPSDWDVKPFAAAFQETRKRNTGMVEHNLLSLSFGRIVRKPINTETGLLPESFETYQIVEPDTLVFRFTDLQNDQRSLRTARVTERGIITSAYGAATPIGLDARFADYLMRSYDTTKVFYSFGGGVRQSLKLRDIARMPVIAPPNSIQRMIADYLDRETAQIDTLIAKQEQLVSVLEERRASMVDAGLRSTKSFVTVQLRRVLQRVDQGVSPQAGAFPATEPHEIGVLKSGCVNHGIFREGENKSLPLDFEYATELLARPGDLLVSRASGSPGLVGSAAVVEHVTAKLLLSDKLFRLVGTDRIESRFLYWFLNSRGYRGQVRQAISGAEGLANNLPLSALKRFRIHLPPLDEQRRIVAYLDEQTAKIDTLIAKAQRFIELAKERREALITAAVTGQLDVTAA